MELKEAVKVYNEYYSCPTCKDAVYHIESFTHRQFCCKDCNNDFLVPASVKINKPKPFRKPERKTEFKRGE